MAGINIAFASDARAFLKGTGDVEKGLDDVADALDAITDEARRMRAGEELADNIGDGAQDASRELEDMATVMEAAAKEMRREAKRAGREIDDEITDGAREASKEGEKLEKKFREVFDEVKRDAKKAGDDVGDKIKKGTREAEGGLDEMGREANSTAKETAASFDGSADSIVGMFQETAANAFAGFGPAGAAAGLAAAAGLGIMWTKWNEEKEKAQARVSDMADAMIEANSRVLQADFINDQLRRIYTNADDAAVKVADLKLMSEQTGISEAELALAFAGDQEARVAALEKVRAASEQAHEDTLGLDQATVDSGVKREAELGRWLDDLEKLGGEYDNAAGRAAGMDEALQLLHTKTDESVGNTRSEYERLRAQMDRLPTTKVVTVTADLSEAERQIRAFTNGSYAVTVNGKVTGMRYE